MKATDYSKIAKHYDKNELRLQIPRDKHLAAYVEAHTQASYDVLDLGCGTGNYLLTQMGYFSDLPVRWCGVEPSAAMLAQCREKLATQPQPIELLGSRADVDLPYEDENFDYIAVSFAFHHFTQKSKALDQIQRLLKPGGVLMMKNIAPFEMPRWWLYQLFPQAWCEDQKRFWSNELLFYELEARGFSVALEVRCTHKKARLQELLPMIVSRDISELAILSERDYQSGKQQAEQRLVHDPSSQINDMYALMECVATKEG